MQYINVSKKPVIHSLSPLHLFSPPPRLLGTNCLDGVPVNPAEMAQGVST